MSEDGVGMAAVLLGGGERARMGLTDGAVEHEGLRSRKKAQSRRDIERALLELVLEQGYEKVTIGDACQRAGVSKKTFFNYFPSKDAAIRGRLDAPVSTEELSAVLEGDSGLNYIDAIVQRVQPDLMEDQDEDPKIQELRRAVLAKSPQLLFRGHKDIANMQAAISEALRIHLVSHPERRLLPDMPLAVEVLTATSAVASMMRIRLVMSIRDGEAPEVIESRTLLARALR